MSISHRLSLSAHKESLEISAQPAGASSLLLAFKKLMAYESVLSPMPVDGTSLALYLFDMGLGTLLTEWTS
jgi:hypothetical protein